jgi:hypothetical protein
MKDSTKRLLLIGGSLIVVGGVIYYFVRKAKPSNGSGEEDEVSTSETAPTITPLGTPIGIGGTGIVNINPTDSTLPIELKTLEGVKSFQDFMDNVGPWVKGIDGKYKKLNKGTGYGIAGPSTKAIFNVYGDLYRVYLRSRPKGRIIPLGSGLDAAAIDVDLSNGTIARYSNDGKFVHFAKNYGSAINTGTWTGGGRKITITYGPKKGKVIAKTTIWDVLKELIA